METQLKVIGSTFFAKEYSDEFKLVGVEMTNDILHYSIIEEYKKEELIQKDDSGRSFDYQEALEILVEIAELIRQAYKIYLLYKDEKKKQEELQRLKEKESKYLSQDKKGELIEDVGKQYKS